MDRGLMNDLILLKKQRIFLSSDHLKKIKLAKLNEVRYRE
jgi:hypothetical protein